jgi:hypothetical protein
VAGADDVAAMLINLSVRKESVQVKKNENEINKWDGNNNKQTAYDELIDGVGTIRLEEQQAQFRVEDFAVQSDDVSVLRFREERILQYLNLRAKRKNRTVPPAEKNKLKSKEKE